MITFCSSQPAETVQQHNVQHCRRPPSSNDCTVLTFLGWSLALAVGLGRMHAADVTGLQDARREGSVAMLAALWGRV
jgi:hypothetical protein